MLLSISVSVFIKYGPFAQFIPAIVPETTLPPPISMLTKPLVFGVGFWVSTYTAVPVAVACKIEIFIPTVVVTKLFEVFRITA